MGEPRVEQWKRKLLDLSLRNPLLNVRDGSRFLPLRDGTSAAYQPPEPGADLPFSADVDEPELRKRLQGLYRTSRSMFNETGVTSLFLAVGFLNWNEKAGEGTHRAPLMLIPAQLVRQAGSPGYKLQRTEEDAVVNFCVMELLRSQFGIRVEGVEGADVGDGDPDFTSVFSRFTEAVRDQKEWSVSTGFALGIFTFSKVVIWKDLAEHFGEFRKHPFVAHLAEGTGLYDDKVPVFPQEEVERHIQAGRLFCPMSADSSQLTAVLYSELGKSFVLHGPPGTGKSQTITNIIAHNMTLGKRVLFVSEKKAALDVVYKRLSDCGLAPFCLEMHSNKVDKASVMRQFAEALATTPARNPANWDATCTDVASSIDEIGAYARELHRPCANGLSAYDCLARLSGKHPSADASLIAFDAVSATPEKLASLGATLRKLAEEWKGLDPEAYAALAPVVVRDWTPAFQTQVASLVDAFLAALDDESSPRRCCKLLWLTAKSAMGRVLRHPLGKGTREERRARLQALKARLDALRFVQAYRINRDKTLVPECRPFVEAMESGRFAADEVLRIFEDGCAEKTFNAIVSKSRALAGFSGLRQEECIARFRESDARYTDSVRKVIVAKLSKRIYAIEHPEAQKCGGVKSTDASINPDVKRGLAFIKRECEKKKRFVPPRKLLAETQSLAMWLKPCFLMSPLSVAQYLPAVSELFDMVVFDEASQMTVWDAVGVIARGKQLVVVGDPKQLPPTSFFTKGDAQEDDGDAEEDSATEDLESVLDECLANGLHSAYLNWHYRSRHESLIAFSNRHYYEDRLNTFPAAVADGEKLGVSLRYVEGGVYDHKSHANRGEAKALVDFLFERLERPDERKRSWGIVTFSVSQRKMIEDMIEVRAAGTPWAADFFDDARPDAFFVKNLENVQGDERDVIVFSIGYAPDAQGRFAMAFGPINASGGERRLNVAITRAREQVIVFASVHASDIHPERTNSVGVKHLKALMEFAETGHLEGDAARGADDAANGTVGEVRAFLEANGYAVDERVGRSALPIDLAVRDPGDPGRYALAIECDGPTYAAQRTVRDRDVQRASVLSQLGWRHFRLWSMDWAYDRKRTEARLLEALPRIGQS